jgi:hypothetical protein
MDFFGFLFGFFLGGVVVLVGTATRKDPKDPRTTLADTTLADTTPADTTPADTTPADTKRLVNIVNRLRCMNTANASLLAEQSSTIKRLTATNKRLRDERDWWKNWSRSRVATSL